MEVLAAVWSGLRTWRRDGGGEAAALQLGLGCRRSLRMSLLQLHLGELVVGEGGGGEGYLAACSWA